MENFNVFNKNPQTSTYESMDTIQVTNNELVNQSGSNSNHAPIHSHQDILTIFKLTESSIQVWKSKFQNKPISYKLCIIDFKRKDSELEAKNQDDVSSNISEYVNGNSKVEIAILNEDDCKFKNQEQFGHIFNPKEYVFLKASIDDISKWAYMIDFYIKDVNNTGLADHIGFSYLLPLNLKEDNGFINTVITGNNHKPIGQITFDYLIVKPLKGYSTTLVGLHDWQNIKQSLEIGHRGSGKWRRSDKIENVLENTIASFNYAAKNGADMVELDVHLSKDRVPVIYHDFSINISIKKKTLSDPNSDTIKVTYGVKDLTLNELQMLKLSPVNNLNHDFSDSDPLENQPFPTLQQVLESVVDNCGFNVEIKYPMKKVDGEWEGPFDHELSENEFVDIILTTLMEHSKDRRIVLSTFHPDICTLLRLKQNRYPVLFLTQGQTERYKPFSDQRASLTNNAIYLAKIFNFYGVNIHAEDLFRNIDLIKYVKNFGLKLFTWGEDINSNNAVTLLKAGGVDGIIYDKIDEYNTKFVATKEDIVKQLDAGDELKNTIETVAQQQMVQ